MSEQHDKPSRATLAAAWWRGLQDLTAEWAPNPNSDRAARARLRRATPEEALTDGAVHALYRRLWGDSFRDDHMALTLRLALVLVHVRPSEAGSKDSKQKTFGEAIGRTTLGDPDSAPLKPLRFKRLLQARANEDIIRQFRRAVDLAGNKANVQDLARLLLSWTDDQPHTNGDKTYTKADRIRTKFAFDYFGAGAAAPQGPAEPDQTSL
jgi:CRISPR system Cascade subunit CasB